MQRRPARSRVLIWSVLFAFGALLITPAPEPLEAGVGSCRLLIIDSDDGEPYASLRMALLSELERLGCGENADHLFEQIDYHSINNELGLARRIWQTSSPEEYDAVVIQGTIAAIAAHELAYGRSSPTVFFANVTDPVGIGLVDQLSGPPPANFTGIAYPVPPAERLRLIRNVFPDARDIGLIHTDMPQSVSYNRRLEEALQQEEFQDLRLHRREVPFVPGRDGLRRSAALSREFIEELDPVVDVFLTPNDQLGVHEEFVRLLVGLGSTPVIATDEYAVTEGWGAVLSLFGSTVDSGRTLAGMIYSYLSGTSLQTIEPREPTPQLVVNRRMAERFEIEIPEKWSDF